MATGTESSTFSTESMKNKASDAASSAADKAKQTASKVGQKAEDATHAVGSGMKNLADTIRHKGPQEGALGAAACSVADTLDSGGRYLEEEGISGIAGDMTTLIRRNPIPAMFVGIGLGFVLARATMRR